MRSIKILLSLANLLTFCILAIPQLRGTLDGLFNNNYGVNYWYTDAG